MLPVARTEKLLVQEVENELVVYDQETNAAHCLKPVAAIVWHYCDGQNTVEDIAHFLERELNISADAGVDIRGLVYLSLEELEQYHLIKQYLREPVVTPAISRRKTLKTATLVGGFALGSMFPLVRSIMAPSPAMAASKFTVKCTCSGKSVTVTCSERPKSPSCDCSNPNKPKASCG